MENLHWRMWHSSPHAKKPLKTENSFSMCRRNTSGSGRQDVAVPSQPLVGSPAWSAATSIINKRQHGICLREPVIPAGCGLGGRGRQVRA